MRSDSNRMLEQSIYSRGGRLRLLEERLEPFEVGPSSQFINYKKIVVQRANSTRHGLGGAWIRREIDTKDSHDLGV